MNLRLLLQRPCLICGLAAVLSFGAKASEAQVTIAVPSQAATVQAAIDSATDGDTVVISPGTYTGSIDFHGKSITVRGAAAGVILTGTETGPVVLFHSGESRSAVLDNVTITNGAALTPPGAGGIFIEGASPTIQNSVITGNQRCGIAVFNGAPAIRNNEISANILGQYATGCIPTSVGSEPYGGGILLYGASPNGAQASVIGNTIENNEVIYGSGGINVLSAGLPLIENNIIRNNTSHDAGAGLFIEGDTAPLIIQNLIYANTINPDLVNPAATDSGAGINVSVTAATLASDPVLIVNNTVADNSLLSVQGAPTQGSQFFASEHMERVHLTNNLLIGTSTQPVVACLQTVPATTVPPPTFDHNDVFSPAVLAGQSEYGESCTDQTGTNGNISTDPVFASTSSSVHPFQLQLSSPAVDAGDNTAEALPPLDVLGQPRIQNAKGLATAAVDLGVYEYPGIATSRPGTNFQLSLSSAALTSEPGNSGAVSAVVMPVGFNLGTVVFSCIGLPSTYSCNFAPATLNATEQIPYTSRLTLAPAESAQHSVPHDATQEATLLPLSFSCFLAALADRRKYRRRRPRINRRNSLAALALFSTMGCSKTEYVSLAQPISVQIQVQATAIDSGITRQQPLTVVLSQ